MNRPPTQRIRLIVTALVERDDHLLLTQLAQGRFAGFWLLPSSTVETGTLEDTARRMVRERTGYPVIEQEMTSVLEDASIEALSLRFLFKTRVGDREAMASNGEIVQARWFSRQAVEDVLNERDIVPNLGVMAIVRAWVDRRPFRLLEPLNESALCPCGSGDLYASCCGWDAR